MNKTIVVAFAALAACAINITQAHAQGASIVRAYTGVEPKYNRPVSTTALSGVGTAVPYLIQPLSVSVTGSYNLLYAATLNNGTVATYADTILSIYTGTFNPSAPLTGIIFFNDDLASPDRTAGSAGFTLTAGVNYTLVGTTFDNGTYTGNSTFSVGTVTRPTGSVVTLPGAVAVPEAGSLALLLPAFGVLGAVIVRRRTAK